jgi:hypothetical protein
MGGNEIEIDDDIKLIEKTMPKQQQNLIVQNSRDLIIKKKRPPLIFQSDFREASFTHLIFGSIFNLPLAVG